MDTNILLKNTFNQREVLQREQKLSYESLVPKMEINTFKSVKRLYNNIIIFMYLGIYSIQNNQEFLKWAYESVTCCSWFNFLGTVQVVLVLQILP